MHFQISKAPKQLTLSICFHDNYVKKFDFHFLKFRDKQGGLVLM